MLKKILLALGFFSAVCNAQNQGNIWLFGDHAGLDFNSGLPVSISGQTFSPDGTPIEGTASISDSTGSLLFYSNGTKVWNKNHQVMPHGDSLLGSFSSTQSVLIVPKPGSSRLFYAFTTDDFYLHDLQNGFRYSVIDICLDNGSGDVDPTQKNIKLLDTVAEKLTAVRHINGVDYWIIVHKYYSDAFYAYLLSSTGVGPPVISHIGSRHPNINAAQSSPAAIGSLKASPNGSKLAIVNGNAGNYAIAEYFDFDNNTGAVSNWVDVQTNPGYAYYGVSFSPDNSKLYITCYLNNNGVFQFDLNRGGGLPDSVRASRTKVAGTGWTWGLQLAPNGKIYVASSSKYLSVIDSPNSPGISCNFIDSAVYLTNGTCSYGLPNFVDSYSYSNSKFNCSSGIAANGFDHAINIFPNPTCGKAAIQTNLEIKEVLVYNTIGEVISISRRGQDIDICKEPVGIYFCKILTNKGESVLKLFKIN